MSNSKVLYKIEKLNNKYAVKEIPTGNIILISRNQEKIKPIFDRLKNGNIAFDGNTPSFMTNYNLDRKVMGR